MERREIKIEFPGGNRVDAYYKSRVIPTDQSPPVGEGSAPAPLHLFLASIGACAGYYVLNFCNHRGIPTEGIYVLQKMELDDESHLVKEIELEIQVPPTFPEKYLDALIRAANQCAVKKHLESPPVFKTTTKITH